MAIARSSAPSATRALRYDDCEFAPSSPAALQQHREIVHWDIEKEEADSPCGICPQVLKSQHARRQHERRRSCGEMISYAKMKAHHSYECSALPEKLMKCPYPKCEHKTTTHSMKRHVDNAHRRNEDLLRFRKRWTTSTSRSLWAYLAAMARHILW